MTETLVWIAIGVVVLFCLRLAAPHHQRLIDAAHAKDKDNWD